MNDFEPTKDCLKDKTILVTGTGSGIGKAAAKILSKFGAQLILLSKDADKLASLHEELGRELYKESDTLLDITKGLQRVHYTKNSIRVNSEFDKVSKMIS